MCGISRGIEAEEHVKIPEELSLNFHVHGFWFLALPLEFPQVVSYNFAEFPSVKLFLQNVHKGKVTWQILNLKINKSKNLFFLEFSKLKSKVTNLKIPGAGYVLNPLSCLDFSGTAQNWESFLLASCVSSVL